MQPYVIGIDIGTGSTKAVAVATSGEALASAQVHYPASESDGVLAEQDPEVIWNAFAETIRNLRSQVQAPPLGVSLSSCMHSLILVDAAGVPLTPNITWADRRSAAIAEALRQTPEGEAIYKATGTPLHAMSPLCKIKWFSQHEHTVFKNTSKFISIKEYIWHRLFGVYEIDHSVASATGLFHVVGGHWFLPALQFCGIRREQLSTPVPTHFIRTDLQPTTASLLHLPPEIPFCIGASDGCLANVGSNALGTGTAALTIGTSGAVRVASTRPVAVFPDMLFNYRLDANTFICGGAVNNGGNVVRWLLQQFLERPSHTPEDYAALFDLVAQAPAGCEGLFCLPYLHGERTPLWDEQTCGVFFGFRPQHRQSHFIRAAVEGVCFGLYAVLKKLEEQTGPVHTLQVSGGVVHSDTWMQVLADVTGKTLCLVQSGDASAIGAALFYFKVASLRNDYLPAAGEAEQIFKPHTGNHVIYQKAFPVFSGLYQTVKATMHHHYQAAH